MSGRFITNTISSSAQAAKSQLSFTYDQWALWLVGMLLSVLTLLTILGNGLVLLSLARYPSLRSMSNCLIGNLAVSDFLLSLTVLPMSVGNDLLGHWIFGPVACNIWLSIDVLYCTASIWSLVAIAFDRFTATTFPVWYREQRNTGRVAVYCGVVWGLSLIICLPPLIGWNGSEFQNPRVKFEKSYSYNNSTGLHVCVLFSEKHYVVYSALGSFIIPLIIMVALYSRIFLVLRRIGRVHRENRRKTLAAAQSQSVQNGITGINQMELNKMPKASVTDTSSSTGATAAGQELANAALSAQIEPVAQISKIAEQHQNNLGTCRSSGSNSRLPSRLRAPSLPNMSNTERLMSDGELTSNEVHRLLRKCHSNKVKATMRAQSVKLLRLQVPETKTDVIKKNVVHHPRKRPQQSAARADKREARATKRMALIIFIFVLCWIPFTLMYVTRSLCGIACPEVAHAQMFVIWLGYANSGLNPLLYTIFNDDFRLAFKRLLACK